MNDDPVVDGIAALFVLLIVASGLGLVGFLLWQVIA